jgi:hypothetical protein
MPHERRFNDLRPGPFVSHLDFDIASRFDRFRYAREGYRAIHRRRKTAARDLACARARANALMRAHDAPVLQYEPDELLRGPRTLQCSAADKIAAAFKLYGPR